MIEVQILKEIREFCDTTRLLYKLALEMFSFDKWFDLHGML